MKVKFECSQNDRQQKGNYNPRYMMELIIPVLEKYKEFAEVKFEYEGYYGQLNIHCYDADGKEYYQGDHYKNREFFQKVSEDIV